MSYPPFLWNNPATIGWTITDKANVAVTGAVVTATMYSGRSAENPAATPGNPIAGMTNLSLVDQGGGLYTVDVPATAIPAPGVDYILVIEGRVSGVLITHDEELTSVIAVSDKISLCTLKDMKDWLSLPDSDTTIDTMLKRVIISTSRDFMRAIRRPAFYPPNDYTEIIRVSNWQTESRMEDVFVSNYPINSVASVYINDMLLPEYDPAKPDILGWTFDKTLAPEDRQSITLRGLYWPIFETWLSPRRSIYRPAPMRVQVAYNGGYDTVPDDVAQGIIEWVSYKKGMSQLQQQNPTAQSLYIGAYRQDTMVANSMYKAMSISMPESVSQLIDMYKRPIVG